VNYIKQYDTKHKIQRLYVHWDVSTQCNFKCSYCYAISEYKDRWGKIDLWAHQRLVIRNLANATLPLFLGLLGGEPTIHPHYDEMVDLCHKAISKHKDGRLYITTNGSKPSEWFEKHKFYENTYFLWSVHFEYEDHYGKDFELILNNIKIMKNKGFRNKVNVMLHPNKKMWPKIHKLVDALELIDVEIHPHFLYDNGNVHALHHYSPEFYDEFKRFENYPNYLVFEDNNNNKKIYNDYTIFNNKMTSFTGWNCWNNNYEIDFKGVVHSVCFDGANDLVTNFNYFKNIKEIKPKVCPHSTCNCDGLLKIYKEKI